MKVHIYYLSFFLSDLQQRRHILRYINLVRLVAFAYTLQSMDLSSHLHVICPFAWCDAYQGTHLELSTELAQELQGCKYLQSQGVEGWGKGRLPLLTHIAILCSTIIPSQLILFLYFSSHMQSTHDSAICLANFHIVTNHSC